MTMRMKKLFSILAVAATVLLTACDEHQDFPDTAMKVTHILTTDGKVMPYETYEQSCKQAIAVVFNVNQRKKWRKRICRLSVGHRSRSLC